MKRLHLFEFLDSARTPRFCREAQTDLLDFYHRFACTERVWAPLIEPVMRETGETTLLDLCSGSGGPIPSIVSLLRKKFGIAATAALTDRYPVAEIVARYAAGHDAAVRYLATPVDATDVPDTAEGIRTMFVGFHHLRPAVAKQILGDAFYKRKAICIFEHSARSWQGIGFALLLFLGSFLFTPFTKPGAARLFFTYAVPLIPLLFGWDSIVSQLRTYTPGELQAMTADLAADDYRWEIGTLRGRIIPLRIPCCIGIPGKGAAVDQGRGGPGGGL